MKKFYPKHESPGLRNMGTSPNTTHEVKKLRSMDVLCPPELTVGKSRNLHFCLTEEEALALTQPTMVVIPQSQ